MIKIRFDDIKIGDVIMVTCGTFKKGSCWCIGQVKEKGGSPGDGYYIHDTNDTQNFYGNMACTKIYKVESPSKYALVFRPEKGGTRIDV